MTRVGEGRRICGAIHVDPPLRDETEEEGAIRSTIAVEPPRLVE
ncbi:hypothetical protein [Methylobacterium sp. MA0201]